MYVASPTSMDQRGKKIKRTFLDFQAPDYVMEQCKKADGVFFFMDLEDKRKYYVCVPPEQIL